MTTNDHQNTFNQFNIEINDRLSGLEKSLIMSELSIIEPTRLFGPGHENADLDSHAERRIAYEDIIIPEQHFYSAEQSLPNNPFSSQERAFFDMSA